jgi:hypothetical protein
MEIGSQLVACRRMLLRAGVIGAGVALAGVVHISDYSLGRVEARAADAQDANWRPAAAMSEPRLDHCAATLPDGRVLVAGGLPDRFATTPHRTALIYDPEADTWTPTADMAEGGPCFALVLSDGRVLVVVDIPERVADHAEIYDAGSGIWRPVRPPHGDWIRGAPLLLADGRVFVLTAGAHGLTQLAEVYDPGTDTWTAAAPPTITDIYGLERLNDGRLLAVGVRRSLQAGGGLVAQRAVVVYDPIVDAWTDTGVEARPIRCSGAGLAALTDGRMLCIDADQAYDPISGTWSTIGHFAGAFPYPHVLLADGRLLVGGNRDDPLLPSVQVYDPRADAWAPAPAPGEPRVSHTLTLLPNGAVLIVGGVADNFGGRTPLATAERYRP